ncbi:MAG: hypothetical protein IT370_03810 [Deltaproteobacteria bacterium]|nr:hypothetical protein [Deltaproteobacteria bacterium]
MANATERAAARVARVLLAGRALGLDVAPLATTLAELGEALAPIAWGWSGPPWDELGVTFAWPRDPAVGAGVEALLGRVAPALAAALPTLSQRRARTREVTLRARTGGQGAGLGMALRLTGAAPPGEEGARLLGVGLPEPLTSALLGLVTSLGGVSNGLEVGADVRGLHVAVDVHLSGGSSDRLHPVLDACAVSPAQRRLVSTLWPVLAPDGAAVASLRAHADDRRPQLWLCFAAQPWDDVVKLAQGLHPDARVGDRLGELAGAFDAARAEALELALGPTEPPRLRVAALVSAEVPRNTQKSS